MRLILIAILSMIYLGCLQSQIIVQEGVTWRYNLYHFSQSEPLPEYNECYIEGDTMINLQACKIYHRTYQTCDQRTSKEFIYFENEILYYYEHESNRFLMLYDFSAEVGDTLTMEFWPSINLDNDSLFYIKIDSIDIFELDTFSLKRFYVSYDTWDDETIEFSADNNQGVIIEEIGSLTNFFHFYDNGLCDASYNIGLRCLTLPDLVPYELGDIACDSITSALNLTNSLEIKLYPNPSHDYVSVRSDKQINNAEIIIYDLTGNELFRQVKSGKTELDEYIELSFLPKSMYLISIFEVDKNDVSKLVYTQKVIKN